MRQTSHSVYRQIEEEGLLSEWQWNVYHTLFLHGPMTQGELWKRFFPQTQRHNVAPRFAELEERRVIQTVDKRPCTVTGRTCLVWDVTDRLPVEAPVKRDPVLYRVSALEKEVEALREAIGRLQTDQSGQGHLFGSVTMKGH